MELQLDQILHGDCLDLLQNIPSETIDACVSDVPYGLGSKDPTPEDIFMYVLGGTLDTKGDFMGADWSIPSIAVWREVYRVLKPGGHVLSFAGTRTFDFISIGLRMAGFECRDTIGRNYPILQWVTGQGMPKSHDISKGIDKRLGRTREVTGVRSNHLSRPLTASWDRSLDYEGTGYNGLGSLVEKVTVPASEEAKQWEGWGSGLKPAWEPILVFRKPLAGTLASNVLKHGTGGLNIDATRVRHASKADFEEHKKGVDAIREKGGSRDNSWKNASDLSGANEVKANGRWPSNVLLEHSESCRRVGTKRVRTSYSNAPTGRAKGGSESAVYGSGKWKSGITDGRPLDHADEDGRQEVDAWECTEGCPVRALDDQTGDRPSTLTGRADPNESHEHPGTEMNPNSTFLGERTHLSKVYADAGGASRFFTQIEAEEDGNKGRWPANLLLIHAPGCQMVGTKQVKTPPGGARRFEALGMMNDDGWQPKETPSQRYAGADGLETVAAWECVDGCPVKALDAQSGHLKSGKDVNPTEGPVSGFFGQEMAYYSKDANYGDEGGASRFFTQIGGEQGELDQNKGRWPANLVLIHAPGCERLGLKKVKAITGGTKPPVRKGDVYAEAGGYNKLGNEQPPVKGYSEPDGQETVELWRCVEGCPVKELDEQSGERRSSYTSPNNDPLEVHVDVNYEGKKGAFSNGARAGHDHVTYQDAGGASRFFTQVAGEAWECADGCPVKEVSEQGVEQGSHAAGNKGETNHVSGKGYGGAFKPMQNNPDYHADEGGVDRFFSQFEAEGSVPFRYIPKANRKEAGCGEFEVQHTTVKPLELMRWLVKLVTQKGGVVLDPYAGSGSTLHAAVLEGMHYIGMERDEGSYNEAKRRLDIVHARERERQESEALFDFAMGGDSVDDA